MSTARVTTRGRRSGKSHTVPVWFALGDDADVVYLATLNMDRDWPKNARVNPDVEVEIEELRLHGTARLVDDREARQRIESLLASKYIVARVGSWIGLRPQGVFEVRVAGEVP